MVADDRLDALRTLVPRAVDPCGDGVRGQIVSLVSDLADRIRVSLRQEGKDKDYTVLVELGLRLP